MKLKRITGLILLFFVLINAVACGKSKNSDVTSSNAVSKLEDISSKDSLTTKPDEVENVEDKESFHKENEVSSEKSEEDLESVTIKVVNNIGYDIEVGYISPTEKDAWGTEVFKNIKNGLNGEAKLTLLSGSDTYDILITDVDGDSYTFYGLEIKDGYRVELSWESSVKAEVYNKQRLLKTYTGEFASEEDLEDVQQTGEEMPYNITGEATQGKVDFTVYNESPFDICYVYFGPNDASIDDIDILGSEDVLSSERYLYSYSTTLPREQWNNVEWTLFVVDMDEDTSLEYKVCNPFALSYVDIIWDSEAGGYKLNCYYRTSV